MRENKVECYLVTQVQIFSGEIRKVRWLNHNGAPDRLVWIPRWRFPKLAELKATGKYLEDHQVREHKRLRKMGFQCFKLDSFEDVDVFLRTK